MQVSHRNLKNPFSHAPTRRAEYFNQLELKKSILLGLENDTGHIDVPQSPGLRTGAPLSTRIEDHLCFSRMAQMARLRPALAIYLNLNS
jgi:hypothetical protein